MKISRVFKYETLNNVTNFTRSERKDELKDTLPLFLLLYFLSIPMHYMCINECVFLYPL
jgi:hypothetical protein